MAKKDISNASVEKTEASKPSQPIVRKGTTTASRLNIRTSPDADGIKNIVCTVPAGTSVEIFDEVGLFYEIRLLTDEAGTKHFYAMKEFIKLA